MLVISVFFMYYFPNISYLPWLFYDYAFFNVVWTPKNHIDKKFDKRLTYLSYFGSLRKPCLIPCRASIVNLCRIQNSYSCYDLYQNDIIGQIQTSVHLSGHCQHVRSYAVPMDANGTDIDVVGYTCTQQEYEIHDSLFANLNLILSEVDSVGTISASIVTYASIQTLKQDLIINACTVVASRYVLCSTICLATILYRNKILFELLLFLFKIQLLLSFSGQKISSFLSFNNCPPTTLSLHFTSFKLRFLKFLKMANDLLP